MLLVTYPHRLHHSSKHSLRAQDELAHVIDAHQSLYGLRKYSLRCGVAVRWAGPEAGEAEFARDFIIHASTDTRRLVFPANLGLALLVLLMASQSARADSLVDCP